jgi:hypothetical protein
MCPPALEPHAPMRSGRTLNSGAQKADGAFHIQNHGREGIFDGSAILHRGDEVARGCERGDVVQPERFVLVTDDPASAVDVEQGRCGAVQRLREVHIHFQGDVVSAVDDIPHHQPRRDRLVKDRWIRNGSGCRRERGRRRWLEEWQGRRQVTSQCEQENQPERQESFFHGNHKHITPFGRVHLNL